MNIWKKSLAVCLALVMVLSLAACGGDKAEETPAAPETEQTETPAAPGSDGPSQPEVEETPDTGITMTCRTDLPGVQIYTGNCTGDRAGKNAPIGKHSGVCLETQFYPDSPNHPAFPSATLKAGTEFKSVTEYIFSK